MIAGQESESDRRKRIMMLIKNGFMTNEAICRDIENAIRIFESNPKMYSALQKWRSDLRFTRELSLKKTSGVGILTQK